jgi:putative transposase
MCETLGVSKSGFHAWERRAPSDRALSDAWLISRMKEIHENARGVYGSRRVQAELRLGQGIVVSRKRIRRLMRQAGISGLVKVKKGRTTIRVPGVRVADDLVERKFRPDAPNLLWVADITYLRTWEGWLYLAPVQDAYSRRDCWLGDDRAHAHRARRRRAADGRRSSPARARPHTSQRPGIASWTQLVLATR